MRWQLAMQQTGRIILAFGAAIILAALAMLATRPRSRTGPAPPLVLDPPGGPASAHEWVRRGDVALRGRRLGRAELAFREALRLDPRLAPARLGLAWIHTLRMRQAEALSEYSALAELRPLDFDQVLVWTQVRCEIWDLDKVTEPLRECLLNDPEDRWVRLALAEGLREIGKREEAEDVLGPLNDAVPEVRVIRARLAIDRNDLEAADTILIQAPTGPLELAELRGKIALARRDAPVAIARFCQALASAPDHRRSLLGLAQALRMAGQAEAIPPILTTLRKLDRLHDLVRKAAESTHEDRLDGPLLRDLGTACEALGYHAEARAWLQLAIAANPLDSHAQAALFRLGKSASVHVLSPVATP
jgi:tetratricopeptide (TPR) repeat protein